MPLPFTLPDWAPPWASFVIVSVAALFVLAFLLMPFSVFGLKGRLDSLEAQLEDIQRDLRAMAVRLPAVRGVEYDMEPELSPPSRSSWVDPVPRAPPAPRPAPPDSPPPPPNRGVVANRPGRSEPRLSPH